MATEKFIDRKTIKHLAQLARISLTEAEISRYQQDLEAILGYLNQLDQLDLKAWEPTSQVSGLKFQLQQLPPVSAGQLPAPADLIGQLPVTLIDGQIKVAKVI